jgi:hypothetical protein
MEKGKAAGQDLWHYLSRKRSFAKATGTAVRYG